MLRIALVVPCYNESRRLAPDAWVDFLASPEGAGVSFYFANDGSEDSTSAALARLCSRGERMRLFDFPTRRGKAETVRDAMLAVLTDETASGAFDYIGFWDADLATPLNEIPRLRRLAVEHTPDGIFCSRVKRMGATVERNPLRHALGRVFATAVSLLFELSAYDTQCGAKLFKADTLPEVLREPFISPWIFDVELILRMKRRGRDRIVEMPVATWLDVGDSTMKLRDFARVPLELARIVRRYR